ncbi:MAG: ATP-binding protein [Candidatus Saccharibacteria bacterium]|nr:ATP-binding protein [Candidatus Saccharibacteria bacterium]
MKYIARPQLDILKKTMGTPDIKVITGVRRSGKSTLLKLFVEYVAKTVTDANIVQIDFNNISFEHLREYHALNDYIEEHYLAGHQNFVFIDEVQMCAGFEQAINSLHSSGKYDLYVTGSNAFLLGSDLATLFAGRVFPVEVYPFSFREYLEYERDNGDEYQMFDKYLTDGGFAGSYIYNDLPEKTRYIREVYDTMIIRDIEQKYSVENTVVLREVGDFLMDNISRFTTANNIANVLSSSHQATNNKTVGAYLDYFCRAFAFYQVKRYDIEGKNYLRSQDKYYIVDHTLRYAKLGTRNLDMGSIYENIVAIELMRRGYEVYVGVLRTGEVDFVAMKQGSKEYIQVSYDIGAEETFSREVKPLLSIRDAYPKILIARTRQPEYQYEGVRIIDIADWLKEF